MTLRPQKAGRSRKWRRASLSSKQKWSSNWHYQGMRKAWRDFQPSQHKRGLLALFLVCMTLVGLAMYSDPTNGLFHNEVRAKCEWQPPIPICNDPSQMIWHPTSPNNDLSEFNVYSGSGSAVWHAAGPLVSSCQSAINTAACVKITPGNDTILLLSKSTVGDLSTASKNLLQFNVPYNFETTGPAQFADFGFFLTTNNTIVHSSSYNPLDDPSVVLVDLFECQTACHSGSNPQMSNILFMLRTIGNKQTIRSQNPSGCPSSGSCYISNTETVASATYTSSFYLNNTGVSGSGSCSATGNNPVTLTGPGCSVSLYDAYGQAHAANVVQTQQLSWLQMQTSQYYAGLWVGSNVGTTIDFYMDNSGGGIQLASNSFTAGPAIDTGGFFGPVIKALINIGVVVLNAILGFVGFIAPAIQAAFNFLETQITAILNLIGNALGFGNIGTTLANFLNALINFFTQQLPQFASNFPSYVTNYVGLLAIQFPYIAKMFVIANAIIAFGTSGIAEGITILTIGLQMVLFGFGTLMWIGFIVYTGDDALGGMWAYLGTLEYLVFKILSVVARVTNLGLDLLIMMIGLIPKPFIQMTAARVPRLPVVETSASMTFPKLDFAEARNGNLLVFWLWAMGIWFGIWFESQNPSLPGSLGALDPAIAANVRLLGNFLPLMQAVTLVSGGLVVAWLAMLPMKMAGIDITESPLGVGLGRVAGPGPGGFTVSSGKKHLVGRTKKIAQARQSAKTEEQAKQAETRKGVEKTEQARRELANRPKPTSKDEARFGR